MLGEYYHGWFSYNQDNTGGETEIHGRGCEGIEIYQTPRNDFHTEVAPNEEAIAEHRVDLANPPEENNDEWSAQIGMDPAHGREQAIHIRWPEQEAN